MRRMHDTRFEKEVQKKMEELAFSPSAAVWEKVEREINAEKRRRFPIFWLFFFGALLTAGAAGIYFVTPPKSPQAATIPASPATATISAPPIARMIPPTAVTIPSATAPTPSATATVQPATASIPSVTSTAPSSTATVPPVTTSTPSTAATRAPTPSAITATPSAAEPTPTGQTGQSTRFTGNTGRRHQLTAASDQPNTTGDRPKPASAEQQHQFYASAQQPGGSQSQPASDQPAGSPPQPASSPSQPAGAQPAASPRETTLSSSPITKHIVSIGQRNNPDASLIKTLAYSRTTSSPQKIQLSPQPRWEAGFTAGVGLSSQNQSFFKETTLQPGLSFGAGVLAYRPLSRKLSVSVGLDLHYYSTQIKSQEKTLAYNTASAVPGSLFYVSAVTSPAASRSLAFYAYSSTSVTFTNRYYFLELPVAVQWQLNHSKARPLFWETGLTASYLVSSNALYYDSNAGAYYKDGGVANSVQLSASTAILFGLPLWGGRLQVGPQWQYSFTNLLNTQITTAQHLWYGGLKINFIPGRGKKK